MSSSIRRGTLAATALALAVVTLSACAAGKDAQTLEIKPDSAATSLGSVKVQNVTIVTPGTGEGSAVVTGRIFNQGQKDETLTAIKVKGVSGRVQLRPAEGEKKLTVPAGGSLALGGEGNASAQLPEAGAGAVRNGNAQGVTFDLSRTGHVSLRAAVVPAHGDYKKFGPTPEPSPSTSSGTPSGSPSGSASDEATSTASPAGPADDEGAEKTAGAEHAAGTGAGGHDSGH
ncbi:DUF461 domain-containing protein [Streptomyces nanshensis]|uniref:DUF461 domain-containing protein n=1 Tax=Streptomyces nanshensis TaxID=518642 RepID=A0A1E7L1H9_9ACTN|nr:DUF461 domain-containing protein [Streptomyces nanshensis]OEV10028.1 hypothetical protein AN218_19515 [Streptomyces nanshensis]